MVFFALNPKSAKCINRSGVAYQWQPTHGGESGKDRLGSDVHAWCFRLRDNHLGRCRNITSHRPASRSAPGYVSTAHPCHHTHTIDHTVAVHSDVTAHTMALERGGRRRATCAMNADALAALGAPRSRARNS